MLTLDLLAASGILKSRLWHYLDKTTKFGLTRPTLNKRLKDQNWSYDQVVALKDAGLWVEPPHKKISEDDIQLLYADLRGGPIYIASQIRKRRREARRVIAGYGSDAI